MSDIDGTEDQAVQYVLGELTPKAAEEFARRLTGDPDLAAEVTRLRRVLGLMPYATHVTPPPGLRDRILSAAAEQQARGAAPAPAPHGQVARTRVEPSRAPRRVVWSRFAAAAAAAMALAFGLDAYRTRQELSVQRELASALLEPNVVRTFTMAGGGGFGKVALDLDGKRGAVVLKHMQPLPAGQIYRLWAQVGDKSVPCGDFGASAEGSVLAQFVVPVESYTAPIGKLFVTVEPSPAGPAPTGPTVMESV